jgi:hypothetical protein
LSQNKKEKNRQNQIFSKHELNKYELKQTEGGKPNLEGLSEMENTNPFQWA